MDPIIEEFTITLKYQVSIDTETGEMTTKCLSRKIDKNIEVVDDKPKKRTSKVKKEESSEPILTLEDNKYCLTQAAVDLMGVEPDCKLDIKYEKRRKETIPVIGSDEVWKTKGGNKLTKSLTVACRGSKNEELSKFGHEFTLVPHEKKEGLFILQNGTTEIKIDEEVKDLQDLEEAISLPVDVDLQDLIDDSDANVKEVNSSMFKL